MRIVCASVGTSANQRHQAPSYDRADAFGCGEDMRADGTIGILNGDRDLHCGLKGLADIKALALAADEDSHGLEVARGFACRVYRESPRALRRRGCFPGR